MIKLPHINYIPRTRVFGAGLRTVARQEQTEVVFVEGQNIFSQQAIDRLFKRRKEK